MVTTKELLRSWFDKGIADKKKFMIVVCDTFDNEDYPIYVEDDKYFPESYERYNGKNMQRVMEVYDLSMDKELQINEHRAKHFPKSFNPDSPHSDRAQMDRPHKDCNESHSRPRSDC